MNKLVVFSRCFTYHFHQF